MAWFATGWVWAIAALVLGILELIVPGYIFLGFAIGALGMVAVVVSPLAPGGLAMLAIFAALSLAAWYALRELFPSPKGSVRTITRDINDD